MNSEHGAVQRLQFPGFLFRDSILRAREVQITVHVSKRVRTMPNENLPLRIVDALSLSAESTEGIATSLCK